MINCEIGAGISFDACFDFGPLAQLGERSPSTREVASSNLAWSIYWELAKR